MSSMEKMYLCVCLPVMANHCAMKSCPSIDSVDIKYAICGRINCIPFHCNERLYGGRRPNPSVRVLVM